MPPYILLALLLGAIYGAFFHMWQGKTGRDLALYLTTGMVGFIVGQVVGGVVGLNLFPIGSLHVFEATLASWGMLLIIRWLKI